MPSNAPPELGSLVDVRQRRFVVVDIQQSMLPRDPLRDATLKPQHIVTLNSVEDDAFGEELRVIWELEPGARRAEAMSEPQMAGFDSPAILDAFLDAVRWGAASAADTRALQAPFRSGIELEGYQLEPVVRAIQMPRANLLIADDVGLGKTIEAGLVCQEFILRHRVRTVLIVCPAALQVQWRDQMRDKFGLEFRIVDTELMRRLRRERGLHVNPWTHYPRLITSIDYLKRDRPLRLMRDALPKEGEPAYPRRFDLLIVDEAHNIAPPGREHYAVDSQRTQAIRLLTPHFEHKLFLSATPHNGYQESFTALLELLDNQRFARGVTPRPEQLRLAMVRRLKEDLSARWDGSPRFARRELQHLEVEYTAAERRIHTALREYAHSRLTAQPPASEVERVGTEFVLKLLKKRLFSSPAAFANTLDKHIATLHQPGRAAVLPPTVGILRQQIEHAEEEFGDEEAYAEATDDVLADATQTWRPPSPAEARLLAEMRAWAERASGTPDSKLAALLVWLRANVLAAGEWTDTRVIIFTEYRDTQKWLHHQLAAAGLAGQDRVMTLYGGMDSESRERIKAAFQADPAVAPVRILLATDAASEGIDLQNHCSRLVHFEIPWNPNRMEQRNGRVDRHGQRAPVVAILHFVGAQYHEITAQTVWDKGEALDADLEFLMRVARKVDDIRRDLGSVGSVITAQVEEAMLGRRPRRLAVEHEEARARKTGAQYTFEQNLRERIKRLVDQVDETRREQHLDPANVAAVVQIALALAGQPPLTPTALPGVWPDPLGLRSVSPVFHVPDFRGSWASCTEGLAHPLTGARRPIVFDEMVARGRDDVVLAHLNHRLVQLALRLLRAEVWSSASHRRLQRVTARVVPNAALRAPAVVLYGRLLVLGGDQQRLHEEVITAGCFLNDGGTVTRMNVTEIERALEHATAVLPPETLRQRFIERWPDVRGSLLAALEARAKERFTSKARALAEREAKEVTDSDAILRELAASISAELHHPAGETVQLTLFSRAEQDQFTRNRSFLEERLAEIPAEIDREAAIIRQRYAGVDWRMFWLATALLIPEREARG